MDYKIYVIIVTYNGSQWIDKCFGSLNNSSIPLKIIAIDNASIDGTPDIIRQKYPEIEVIETGENLGFGKANNIGLKRVLEEDADYAFLLNQDAWIEPDTVKKLVFITQNHPEYGIISPIHLNGKGDALDYNFSTYLCPEITKEILSDVYLNKIKNIYETKYVNAAAWLITSNCISKVGYFNPLYNHYGEDDDYINRTIFYNIKIGIVPHSRIYHDRTFKSWSHLKNDINRLMISNKLMLTNYNAPFRSNLLLFFKTQTDFFTSYLIFRKFKDLKNHFRAFIKTLSQINSIYKSKKKYSSNKK